MTVLVGVRCTDGVVIGADSKATTEHGRAGLTGLPMDKICIIADKVIVAGTGAVGLGQRFEEIVEHHVGARTFKDNPPVECGRILCEQAVKNFRATGVGSPQNGYGYGALVAAASGGSAQLIEFASSDFQPELKRGKLFFVSMGSGQLLAEPFVAFISRVLWKDTTPDIATAKLGVLWSLQHCIKYAPGGVGDPIAIAVLQKEGTEWRAKTLTDEELEEQSQHIETIESRIRGESVGAIADVATATPPDPPKDGTKR
mgnify:CR=1 FL=1